MIVTYYAKKILQRRAIEKIVAGQFGVHVRYPYRTDFERYTAWHTLDGRVRAAGTQLQALQTSGAKTADLLSFISRLQATLIRRDNRILPRRYCPGRTLPPSSPHKMEPKMTFEEARVLSVARQLKRQVQEFRNLLQRNREIKNEMDEELTRIRTRTSNYVVRDHHA